MAHRSATFPARAGGRVVTDRREPRAGCVLTVEKPGNHCQFVESQRRSSYGEIRPQLGMSRFCPPRDPIKNEKDSAAKADLFGATNAQPGEP